MLLHVTVSFQGGFNNRQTETDADTETALPFSWLTDTVVLRRSIPVRTLSGKVTDMESYVSMKVLQWALFFLAQVFENVEGVMTVRS